MLTVIKTSKFRMSLYVTYGEYSNYYITTTNVKTNYNISYVVKTQFIYKIYAKNGIAKKEKKI